MAISRRKPDARPNRSAVTPETPSKNPQVWQLEEELRQTRRELRRALEQAGSASTKLESSNENLERSRAELQSLNEQLVRVNQQLLDNRSEREMATNDLTNLLTSTHLPTLFLDPELKLKRYTPSAETLFRLKSEDLGRAIMTIAQSSFPSLDDLVEDARRVLTSKRPEEREVPSLQDQWYIRRTVPYQTEDHRILGVVVTFTDVTSLKRLELKLRRSETDLRAILDATQESIWVFDPQARIAGCNAMAAERFQTTPEQLTGRPLSELLPPDLLHSRWTRIQKVFDTGQPVIFEDERSGIIFEHNLFPVRDGDAVSRVVSYSRDVTVRRQTEAAIRESESRFRSVLENSLDIVYRFNLQTDRYEFMSPACRTLMGIAPEDMLVMSNEDALARVHPEDLPNLRIDLARLTELGRIESEYRFQHQNGDYRWFSNHITVVRDPAGRPLYRDGIVRDITEHKRFEDEIKHQASFPMLNIKPILELDMQGTITFHNPAAVNTVRQLGLDDVRALLPPDIGDILHEAERGVGSYFHRDVELKGRIFSENFYYAPEFHSLRVYATDDTQARQDHMALLESEAHLRALTRTLNALYASSQAMVRAQDEESFLQDACRIVVEACGHAMVWIGYVEHDDARTIRPVAYSGFEEGYLETLQLTWADTERGRGPTGTAIRTGEITVCDDMRTDPAFAPWRPEALNRGYASSIVFPLRDGTRVFGALTIYARRPDAFSLDETRLLAQLADDLAYGIMVLRVRENRDVAEEALRRSEERFHSLFEGMTEGFALHEIICDDQGRPVDYRFLDLNPAFERLTGLRRMDVVGRTHNEILPNDDPLWVKQYGEVALTGEPLQFENFSPALGKHYEVVAYRPAPWQFAVIFMDVTDRKHSEKKLRQSRQDLARAQEVGQIGSWRLDVRANVLTWSEENYRIFGLPAGTPLTYESFLRCVHPDDRAFVDEHWTAGLRGEPYDVEHRIVADGQVKWVREKAYLEYDEQGVLLGGFGITQDITARKLAEEALREADRRKDDFLAMLAHELRNPLSPIRTSLELIRRHPAAREDAIRKWTETIQRQTLHLTHIVDDLLDTSRISRGAISLKKERVNLSDIVRQSAESHHFHFREKAQPLECLVPPSPMHVEADPVRLAQILSNLLENANKYSHDGACIRIAARSEQGFAVITIEDEGIGISAGDLPFIFDLFYQSDRGLDRARGGLGLGLTLSRRLAELHGGTLEADSRGLGQGSVFTLRLPLAADGAPASPNQEDSRPPAAPEGNLRVLLVEDNQDAAESLAEVLAAWGHESFLAFDGTSALEQALAVNPDVVLLDIGLPGMDGYEVARQLRQQPALARTVLAALTGYNPDQARIASAGFQDYFTKPVDLAKLEQYLAVVSPIRG